MSDVERKKEYKAACDKLAVNLKRYFQRHTQYRLYADGSRHIQYRLYADGSVVAKEDWDDMPEDASDDFAVYDVPVEIVEYIELSNC